MSFTSLQGISYKLCWTYKACLFLVLKSVFDNIKHLYSKKSDNSAFCLEAKDFLSNKQVPIMLANSTIAHSIRLHKEQPFPQFNSIDFKIFSYM